MENVIYADVLVFLNIIITFLLLLACARFLRLSPPPLRFLFGSLLGGASSLIILAPDLGLVFSVLSKLVFSLIIVCAAFSPKSLRSAARETGCFFAVSFLFAGIMLFISSLPFISKVQLNNGAVYIDFSFMSLVLSSVLCFIITRVLGRITRRGVAPSSCEIKIVAPCGTVTKTAIIDTGNDLKDPFTGESVIIADRNSLKSILPENIKRYLSGEEDKCKGIKLIPFSTVASQGLLPCFRADSAVITTQKRVYTIDKPQIAVSRNNLPDIIVPAEFTANSERRKENAETTKIIH